MFKFFKKHHKHALPTFECLGTDMHCHLLPGVDDGSKSAEETAACLRIMKQAGFSNVILTPHYQFPRFPNREQNILERFDTLKVDMAVDGAGDKPNLAGVAGEYRVDSGFDERIKTAEFLQVGGRYILAEFSLHQQVLGLEEKIFELQMKNYEIILAHPERYPYYSSSSRVLQKLKDMGVYFQVNLLSLSGFYDESARRKGFDFINKGWVEFLGTDLHNLRYAQALIDCSHDRKVRKMLDTHTFMNSQLLSKTPIKENKI